MRIRGLCVLWVAMMCAVPSAVRGHYAWWLFAGMLCAVPEVLELRVRVARVNGRRRLVWSWLGSR